MKETYTIAAERLGGTRKLVEAALMVAMATVLSLFKLAELPYGGAITIASMLPILLISYRHGLGWGCGTGLVFGAIQQLLELKTLTFFTSWPSLLAVILLDYLMAFAVIGLGGIFRKIIRRQNFALTAGAAFAGFLCYACHVVAGATVWAGLSIPTQAALAYSFVYNATYMIPETIVVALVAWYLGTLVDFRRALPVRISSAREPIFSAYKPFSLVTGTVAVGALIYDVTVIFAHLQNAETGEFDVRALAVDSFVGSFWLGVVAVTSVAVALVCVLFFLAFRSRREREKENAASGAAPRG